MSLPHGRAKVDATSPRAFAICDRCGFLYNHSSLHWQYDFRGRSLANLRILVCETCEDKPQNQLKPRIIPPDPVSIPNARPERYRQYETNNRITQGNTVDFWTGLPVQGGDTRTTQDDSARVSQQTGEPPFGLNQFPGAIRNKPGNGDIGTGFGVPYDEDSIPSTGYLPGIYYVNWISGLRVKQPMYWTNENGSQLPFVSG